MGKQHQDSDITTLDDIPTLDECYGKYPKPTPGDLAYAPNANWNERISMWKGDITKLQIDAIGMASWIMLISYVQGLQIPGLNAANESLLGGGGVDGAIHRAAGRELLEECRKLRGCPTGEAKSTKAYKLPSKRIIHTVGPMGEIPGRLKSCYESVLEIVKDENLKSVAFCCISTGIYGYDNRRAAEVALKTVRDWMDSNAKEAREVVLQGTSYKDYIGRVVFCVFLDKDVQIYETLLPYYFPKGKGDEEQSKSSST
ncbi:O-acetyl-ADP-ribose deacetylase macrod1 [Linnemannia gamsii]|uniref:O-acetyl-ADP-ribose deacetylase macrod1 n=1 Tax=Linnemannia gamsii TaxID=64522 RepID=A0A9P6RJF4_9FUNG|nr:O-acetyl-ADP-ribose deacetylase macrod1 [Linnemannia gamsii]